MAISSSSSGSLGRPFGVTLLVCAPVLFLTAMLLLVIGLFESVGLALASIVLGVAAFGFTVAGGITLVAQEGVEK